jgi:hypothetical protein
LLHSGYADTFFPGTSVLQTRARYLFFTCWNYLAMNGRTGNAVARKERAEQWVTGHLRRLEPRQRGIIGTRVFPKPPAQPPDFIYWTALRTFGFYRGVGRSRLLAVWDPERIVHVESRSSDEEQELMESDHLAFFSCPPSPTWWLKRVAPPLSFRLTRAEAALLRNRLEALGADCLLAEAARRVRQRAPSNSVMWRDPLVQEAAAACGQRDRIERARKASSLALLVRSIYAALVERVVWKTASAAERRNFPHAEHYLDELRGFWRTPAHHAHVATARSLDMQRLCDDIPKLAANRELLTMLLHVHERLRRVRYVAQVERSLLDVATETAFLHVEWQRKRERARLPTTPEGRERRRDFGPDTVKLVGLDYRWRQVRTLLTDLREGLTLGRQA